jgi:hypothetical protein
LAQPAVQRQSDLDTLKTAAAGRAMVMSADVQRGPGGDTLVMRSGATDAMIEPVSLRTAEGPSTAGRATTWGLWGAGLAAQAAGLPAAGAIGHAVGRGALGEEGDYAGVLRGAVPGMGTLEMMKRDEQAGNPMRDKLRGWLGISEEGAGEWPPRGGAAEPNRSLFGSALFGGGYTPSGGISTEDGAAFGTAAAESIRNGLNGVSIPAGYAATSYGVTPRSAPKPTGGDTASEA